MTSGQDRRVVLVTGGSQGIGEAIVTAFYDLGDQVINADLRPGEQLGDVDTFTCDFKDPHAAASLVEHAVEKYGRIDVVVNNVGLAPFRDSFLDVTDEDWRALIDINVMTMVRLCRAAIPVMISGGGGAIVSIASDVARQPDRFFVDYSMTKAAVRSVSKTLSKEFGSAGIRVNTVSPGPTRTPAFVGEGAFASQLAAELGVTKEEAIDHFVNVMRKLPLGHLIEPRDVAAVVVFLASDAARSVTGSDYGVDAGSIIGI
jgi:NAD(P)-dependent dehydrogenase (short-subunit alcohol dehydrogenase family)